MGTYLSRENVYCCFPFLLGHNAVKQVPPFCLTIPLVLQEICQYFSNKELLKLSLVSKQWHTEARSLLAKRGSLMTNLNAYSRHMVRTFTWPRHDLAALASDLRRMNAAPSSICGINVRVGFSKCFPGTYTSSPGNLDASYDAILDRIKWRNLSVTIGPDWQHKRNCQGFLLVKKVLECKCEDLVEVTITAETNLGEPLIQEILQGCSFPRLKTLKIEGWLRKFELNFIRALVSQAPKLEKLHASASVLTENVLEGSSAVIVPSWEFDPFGEFCHSLLHAIRPARLKLMADGCNFNMQRFSQIMPMVLQNSANTLCSVRMELLFALPLMHYGISFVNVNFLMIYILEGFYKGRQSDVLEYAKAFDFTRIFPKLSEVYITSGPSCEISVDGILEFVHQGRAVSRELKADRAANIKHLHFNGFPQHDKVMLLAQMFPNIETLKVQGCYGEKIPYGVIWENWAHLKSLQVYIYILSIKSLDSVFCGIHPEEIAQLTEEDDDYLEAVNIVPVMPAITCMKELRTLDLKLKYFGRPTDQLVLSRITQLVAFNRCPHLSVNVKE